MKKVNKRIALNMVKGVIALLIGGFLGLKFIISGNSLHMLLFFALCWIFGFTLSKINIK